MEDCGVIWEEDEIKTPTIKQKGTSSFTLDCSNEMSE
jgi:hypothetical protein